MDRQTPEQGWQELQAHIEGFFDQVQRVEREKALLSRQEEKHEAEDGQSIAPEPDRETTGVAEARGPFRCPFSPIEPLHPYAF
ncbi:MAG: hypothetical protein LLG97_03200 [Deltaproteobacteria bacterium]|nr:hypothetical protein [Deltaproteobacteria bacterium]